MPQKPLTILVLEDNPVQSALYEKILKAGGHEVVSINDPVDLVEHLDRVPLPDAILLDIVMPGMDGVSVMQVLERDARWAAVPVLLMTSSPTKDRVIAANQLPVPPEGFLAKPVDPQSMLQQLRAVIAGQEPNYLLRQLQRRRLSLHLGLRAVVETLGGAIRENRDAQAMHEKLLADARREIQSLQTVRSKLKDAPPETLDALQEQIRKLEESCLGHRANAQKAEEQHKGIILQRQEILYKQKAIRDVERRIEALNQVLRRKQGQRSSSGEPSARGTDGVELPEVELEGGTGADSPTGTDG